MLKRYFVLLGVSILLITPLSAFDFTDTTCDLTSVTTPVAESDYAALQNSYSQSATLLTQSQALLALSLQMSTAPETTNATYVSAMLNLADSIGEMADRIGEMGDRIVATELQIGIMADRIVETQRLQDANLALTQANLLKAQQNFNTLLIQFAQ